MGVKVPLDLLEARVVERPDSMVTFMELRTISAVRVSMVQPMGVVSTIRALVLALVSPTLLQATLQASGMPVILERVIAMALAPMVPIGQGMAVFFVKQSEETMGETRHKCGLRVPITGPPLVPCVGCGMRDCDVCCPFPGRLCESCRITSCTPIGALISTVADKDRYHHKCNTITLPPEPTADKLREWISEVKERVRNAFSFDSDYALAWISETERLDYDALGGPCKYPVLDSNFTSAIRDCIKTRAVRDKMNRLTEAAQNMTPPQGIKGRQILKRLLNHLQPEFEDDQNCRVDQSQVSTDRSLR